MNFEAQLLNIRILIVDDDVSLSKSIKEVLVSRGFKNISNAYSISEGIDIFSISKIDLIILDVMLPDGEGYLLAQYIRETSDIPILFLTFLFNCPSLLKKPAPNSTTVLLFLVFSFNHCK